MKAFALILGSILFALVSGNVAFTALLSEPKVDLENTVANVDETIYTDADLHKLILNNLGLLSLQELTPSNEKIINKYGESILTQQILLNHLLLIDADSELLATQPISEEKKAVLLDACSGDDLDTCILSLLYDSEREDSVVTEFEVAHEKKAHVANHFYSSNPSASQLFKDVSYSLSYDANGNVVIVENRTGRKFSVKKNLTKCANEASAQADAQFDLENGVISTKSKTSNSYESAITFPGESKEVLRSFAEEICTLVSMPKFIQKDSTPTLFTFYISSIRKLQKIAAPEQRDVIHRVLATAYKQFKNILQVRFGEKQVAGQVVLTNGTKNVEIQVHQKLSKKESEAPTHQIRMLDDTTTTTTVAATLSSAQVLFRVFGVGFVLVLAVILASLAGIQVEKDTLVYSKFLTVDQRK
jgi:uncharacterized protein YktA (UPF0223 family)